MRVFLQPTPCRECHGTLTAPVDLVIDAGGVRQRHGPFCAACARQARERLELQPLPALLPEWPRRDERGGPSRPNPAA